MKRTVLISGASSDIGLAVCRRYLGAGWRVLAHYRTLRAELEALVGVDCETWQCDFVDTAGLETVLRDDRRLTAVDALINLAAEVAPSAFSDVTAADILRALSVNLVPGLLLMKTLGPAMAERGFGRIVHASSIGVKYGGGSSTFPYSLSKHALEFIPGECRHWAAKNVFVNVVRVGVTETRLHDLIPGKDPADRLRLIPAGRMAAPEEIAEALFWLGSEANGFTTGQVTAVSGGE